MVMLPTILENLSRARIPSEKTGNGFCSNRAKPAKFPLAQDFSVITTIAVSWFVRVRLALGAAAPEESVRTPDIEAPSSIRDGCPELV
jgi:hypothetical protein